jgi:hypothetical protein
LELLFFVYHPRKRYKQVLQLLPALKMMELSEQQMLTGIMQTFILKTKAILLVCFAKVDTQVGIQFLYQQPFLMDHFGITTA